MELSNTRGMESSMEKGKPVRKGRYISNPSEPQLFEHPPPTPATHAGKQ
jgi:hypothetical protein